MNAYRLHIHVFLFSLIKEGLPRISPMVSIAPLAIYHPMRGKRGGGGMVKRQGRNFPLLLSRLLYLRIKNKGYSNNSPNSLSTPRYTGN